MHENLRKLPNGGLASFLTSNMDEVDDNVLAFGRGSGINSMSKIANRMANMGRNGDNELVHVKTGELIVSPEILEKNPKLARELAQEFQNVDENMGDYVVGSDGNSVNPLTGQKEFFLKGLVKGIKNLFTHIAPMVITNFLFPGAGTILKSAIGGGIGGLLSGRGVKGALEGAAMGGLTGGLVAGFSGEQGSFLKNIGTDLGKTNFALSGADTGRPTKAFELRDKIIERTVPNDPSDIKHFNLPETRTITETIQEKVPVPTQSSFVDKLFPKPLDVSSGDFLVAKQKYIDQGFSNMEAFDRAVKGLTPSFLQKWGPTTGLALAGAGALGAFDTPEETVDDPYGVTSTELFEENPEKYSVLTGGTWLPPIRTRRDEVEVPSNYAFAKYLDPNVVTAAHGGEMFPRKTGYIAGPGTETSDDVPAMLSDGEFVMTARAVRGLGNGSRKKGVRKMYDIMKAFEGGVVA
jgi:hypothetical protein